ELSVAFETSETEAVVFDGPILAVCSTDRRNTLRKSLSWGLILQGLAWPFVQLSCVCVRTELTTA
ncbi:hypothetical protein, partial [Yoonia sp.]|uniref:hypothetical protein n=1 Tax=Yoonia sp. TaxID=2212373 RepID=UPI0023A4BE36